MARKVTLAPQAQQAFGDARRWLKQPGSGAAGAARWEALRAARKALRQHPYLGSESPEVAAHRRLVVSGYRLIYQIHPDTGDEATAGDILVVALFGPGQP